MSEKPLFTVHQANALLPTLRPILQQLREATLRARDLNAQVAALTGRLPAANGHRMALEAQVRALMEQLQAAVAQARELLERAEAYGCEVKDPGSGLIDFRSLRGGEVVYLCWRLGEGDIAYWHRLDAGFRGRQPL